MAIKIKIKNTTSEIITETAKRLNVSTSSISNEFHFYWHDVSIMFHQFLGHGFYVRNFCNLILNVGSAEPIVKVIEKRINKSLLYISRITRDEIKKKSDCSRKKQLISENIACEITKLIFLRYSIQLYEKQVLSVYPEKYKPKTVYLEKYISRLEKYFGISMAEFPLQISYHIQKIFVQKLQSEGLLQNPLVYKNT